MAPKTMMPSIALSMPILLIGINPGLLDMSFELVCIVMLISLTIVVWMHFLFFVRDIPIELSKAARLMGQAL
ncbi:hypothetical protein [Tateyamaria omphalii]|uniref:hypothetical protein n=1 Tax=Tateyamaria omphalii TaxID=299262 RepID=UPI0015606F3D|nr:hypothetical protein [Tateyamaria omphalii]